MYSFIKNYKNKISNINYWALLLFIFWLPLKDDYLPVILALWIFTWLLEGNFRNRKEYLPFKALYYALGCYFLLTVFSLIFSNSLGHGLFQIQEKLSMLFFPIFLAGSNQKVKKGFKIFLAAFVLGNIAASFYCLGNAFVNSLVIENGHISFHTYLDASQSNDSFFEMVNIRFNHFSYSYLSVFKHPAYFSIYIVFSITTLVYFVRSGFIIKKWMKVLCFTLTVFFIFMLYLLQSRAGILSMAVVLVIILIIEVNRKLKKRYFIAILSIILLVSLVLFSSLKLSNNIKELNQKIKDPSALKLEDSDVRLQIWYTSILVIKENFWFGTNPSNLTNELVLKYNQLGFKGAADEQLNAHNQYLETFAGLGVFGFLLLLFILVYGFTIALKKHNYLLFFLLIILSINFLYESILNRMAGILFMMFFLSLFVFANIQEFNNNKPISPEK